MKISLILVLLPLTALNAVNTDKTAKNKPKGLITYDNQDKDAQEQNNVPDHLNCECGHYQNSFEVLFKYLVKIYIFSLKQKEACEKSELERNKVYL